MDENSIGNIVISCAIDIHKKLGPGLLETVYEVVLAKSLSKHGLNVQRQVSVPIKYDDITFDEGFKADLVIENKVILELKSVERVIPTHKKQLLTYLKLTNTKLGYLLNFNENLMKEGITRVINGDLSKESSLCASVSP